MNQIVMRCFFMARLRGVSRLQSSDAD
jgi:hypothetical protein